MVIRLECTLFLMLFVWGTQTFSLQRCPGFQQKKSLSHHAVVSKNVDRQSGNQHPATYRNMLARRIRSTTQLNMGVESVSLESLDDYEATGEFLAKAIQVSLDQEWLKQDIHAEIGARVKEIYIETRASGDAEVSSVLMNVGEDLAGRDLHPAFVGGWDVANLASDFLLQRLYGEEAACACNARVPAEVWAACGLETGGGGGGGEGQP